MKSTVVTLSLALVAVACDGRPANDPSQTQSASTTGASTSTTTTTYSGRPGTEAHGNQATHGAHDANGQPNVGGASSGRAVEEQHADGSTWGARGATPSSDTTGLAPTTPAAAPARDERRVDGVGPAVGEKNVDNTKNNERDRHGTLTPTDQGNSANETKITAEIRKQLVISKSLSMTAKNAKIITNGTKVTLRGTVKTEQEKSEIESVAKTASGVTAVDNQLEVKK